MKRFVLAIAAATLLSGCASTQSGHDFDMACADNLQKGVTTKDQVIACLGNPTHNTFTKDGRALHQWIYVKFTSVGSTTKHLALVFDKEGKYEYTHTRSGDN